MNKNIPKQASTAIENFLVNSTQWDMSLAGIDAVHRLEQKFSALTDQPFALTVANATLGLWALFQALEITGADIITTPYTWGGSLAGLITTGNHPIFVDVDPLSGTLDPECVHQAITPETKAILAVDIYGHPCDSLTLRKLADEYNLFLIQDCAQSFGASLNGSHTGWLSDVAVFSVGYGKALYGGEGGVIVTQSAELYEKLVWLTQHSYRQKRDVINFPVNEFFLNARMNPLSAVCADAAFDDALVSVTKKRQTSLSLLNKLYKEGLSLTPVPNVQYIRPSYHALVFEPASKLKYVTQFLQNSGLEIDITPAPIQQPLYHRDMYELFARKNDWKQHRVCPQAEGLCEKLVQLKSR
ncbi:MAG: hypothetical protein DWQ10_02155 [Calditrichaeota bacterium]|nr:MAG: hypothetical protein DWQ10_02155 [Calditrichota bacterium]